MIVQDPNTACKVISNKALDEVWDGESRLRDIVTQEQEDTERVE